MPYEIMLGFEPLLLETYKKLDPSIEGVKILTEYSLGLEHWLERVSKI